MCTCTCDNALVDTRALSLSTRAQPWLNERLYFFVKIGINYNYFQNLTHFLAVNYQGAIYCNYTGWYVSHFARNIKYRFSHDRAPIMNGDSMSYSAVQTSYPVQLYRREKTMVYLDVNRKINHTFNHGLSLRYTMVVHVYVAIMHECQRVHYRTYTCTNHGISDLYHYNQPMSSYS